MIEPTMTVHLDGPFFRPDAKATVRTNIRSMLEAVVKAAESDVRGASPTMTGAFRAGVVGRVESLTGRRWSLHAVVSQQHVYPWGARRGESIRSGRRMVATSAGAQYRGGKLERRQRMFANAARRIRVVRADLAKGIE